MGEIAHVVSRGAGSMWIDLRSDLVAWLGGSVIWIALGVMLLLWAIGRRRDEA